MSRALRRWGALLACLCLVLAAVGVRRTVIAPGVNAVIILDITQSMSTRDVNDAGSTVSRLALAKLAVSAALTGMPCGSRVGLGIFTEYRAFVLFAPIEVCAHFNELRSTLAHIDNRMAWAGYSEVAKGLGFGMRAVRTLEDRPAIVFVTDGHEAPPLNPNHFPAFNVVPGEVRGLVVGVGGARLVPIPKNDPEGRPLGFWQADEVMQQDIYSQGRTGSTAGESLVESDPPAKQAPHASGMEHLTSLRQDHLVELAQRAGLRYLRLEDTTGLLAALTDPALAIPVPVEIDLGRYGAAIGLIALCVASVARSGGRLRGNRVIGGSASTAPL